MSLISLGALLWARTVGLIRRTVGLISLGALLWARKVDPISGGGLLQSRKIGLISRGALPQGVQSSPVRTCQSSAWHFGWDSASVYRARYVR